MFQDKNPNLGNFCRVLQWKMLLYFMEIWYILQPLGIFYYTLVYFIGIWCMLLAFGIFCDNLV
jgi:hypothetical protein